MQFLSDGPEKLKPHIPKDLLEWLDQLYPNRCADLADQEKMIWHKAGQRSVVDELWLHYKAQEQEREEAGLQVIQDINLEK